MYTVRRCWGGWWVERLRTNRTRAAFRLLRASLLAALRWWHGCGPISCRALSAAPRDAPRSYCSCVCQLWQQIAAGPLADRALWLWSLRAHRSTRRSMVAGWAALALDRSGRAPSHPPSVTLPSARSLIRCGSHLLGSRLSKGVDFSWVPIAPGMTLLRLARLMTSTSCDAA